jgi:RimJ/RimL family protein N-acetyltransferase
MAEIRFREIEELLKEGLAVGEEDISRTALEGEGTLSEAREADKEEIIARSLGLPDELASDACEIVFGISEMLEEGMSAAFCYLDEVLYARVYDGERYVFPLPFMMTDDADAAGACMNLARYSTRELIPLFMTDVPRDAIDFICGIFPHVDAYAYADDEDTFYIKVNNECDMQGDFPTIQHGGITLDPICEADLDAYARLCRDRELNKYWGYDVDSDNPDGASRFYLDTVRDEFSRGVAITLAIREGGAFVGEATVYGFDYRGCASIAVRVLPEHHSRGIGSRATSALIELARAIGLSCVTAQIMEENIASVKMTSKLMQLEKRENGKVYFTLSL